MTAKSSAEITATGRVDTRLPCVLVAVGVGPPAAVPVGAQPSCRLRIGRGGQASGAAERDVVRGEVGGPETFPLLLRTPVFTPQD